MKLTSALQEALLALLCYDDKDGSVVASMVEAKDYDPVYRDIAEHALLYRERFKQPPGEHTIDLIDQIVANQVEREDVFFRLFESVQATAGRINSRYVVEKARAFVRHQGLMRAMRTSLHELERDTEEGLEAAEAVLAAALKHGADIFDPGLQFIHDIDASLQFFDLSEEALPTGIPALDQRNLGPAPGRLHLYIASAKTGKSWWLINLATRAHQRAKRVLFVTLELRQPEVAQRLVQSLFSIAKRDVGKQVYRRFRTGKDPADWGLEFERVKLNHLPHFKQDDARTYAAARLNARKDGARLIVKAFPMGTLTPKMLDAYLDLLEQHQKFVPDLICVDYADCMQLPAKVDRWEGLLHIVQYLKRLSVERNVAVATAGQTKASGATAKRVDVQHTGGAWDKVAIADTVLTYSQTDEERRDSVARLFVAAARSDEDRFEVLLSQNYGIGQYVLSSIRVGKHYHTEDAS